MKEPRSLTGASLTQPAYSPAHPRLCCLRTLSRQLNPPVNAPSGGGASEELLTVDLFWGKRVSLRIGTLLVNHVSVEAQLQSLYWQHKLNPLNYNIYFKKRKLRRMAWVNMSKICYYAYMKVSINYINTSPSQCWDYRIVTLSLHH